MKNLLWIFWWLGALSRTHQLKTCLSKTSAEGRDDILDIYWINLDHSVSRRKFMEEQFSYYGMYNSHRIRALTPKDLYIPPDIATQDMCGGISDSTKATNLQDMKQDKNRSSDFRVLVAFHCGRKKNTKRELTVTSSHLRAIRAAIYANNSKPYALILEDDLQFAFDIDFKKLIENAPADFAMLQLITSNERDITTLWNSYFKNQRLWTYRLSQDYW